MNLKNNLRKRNFTNNGGITLIALVITVIVLLILAAISISMLSGDNSILNRATQAKNVTGEKQIQEKIRLAVAGAIANGNGSITEDLLKAELNKYFGENGYDLEDKGDYWEVKVGNVTENVSKSGTTETPTGGGAGGNNTLVLTATDRATESRAAVIEVSVAGEAPTEAELQGKSQEVLQPMFVAACQQLGAPFTSWNDISNGNTAMTIEDAYSNFPFLAEQGYTSAYDLIIKTGAYAEPATFTLNGETITGTSAEFVVTKNSSSDTSYTISATQGSNSGSVTANVTKCKIEEYSTICENNTELKVGTNGLEPASTGDIVVAVCPAGFAYGTSTNVGTVATGLVITDHVEEVTVEEETKRYSDGNEFVWIPVADINSMVMCEKNNKNGHTCNIELSADRTSISCTSSGASTNLCGKLYATSTGENFNSGLTGQTYTQNSGLREPDLVTGYDNTQDSYSIEDLAGLRTNYRNMALSVAKYKGFYVGRYEMGIEGTGSNAKCISKIGVIPTSANDSDTSMWYGLYSKAKTYTNSKNSVTSGMIWGSQYDAMLNFGLTNSIDSSKITANTNGNHSGKLLKTGTWLGSNTTNPEIDKINNIFDLEGNLFEWTQEAYYTYTRVNRGGDFNTYLTSSPSGRNYNVGPSDTGNGNGSRLGLYIR